MLTLSNNNEKGHRNIYFKPGHLYSTNIQYYQKNFLSQFKDKMFTIANFNIKFLQYIIF